MTLALRLGRTLEELRRTMTARELIQWMAFDRLSPIGDQRADIHAAQIATAVRHAAGQDVDFEDVLINWGGGGSDDSEAMEDDAALEAIFSGMVQL